METRALTKLAKESVAGYNFAVAAGKVSSAAADRARIAGCDKVSSGWY